MLNNDLGRRSVARRVRLLRLSGTPAARVRTSPVAAGDPLNDGPARVECAGRTQGSFDRPTDGQHVAQLRLELGLQCVGLDAKRGCALLLQQDVGCAVNREEVCRFGYLPGANSGRQPAHVTRRSTIR